MMIILWQLKRKFLDWISEAFISIFGRAVLLAVEGWTFWSQRLFDVRITTPLLTTAARSFPPLFSFFRSFFGGCCFYQAIMSLLNNNVGAVIEPVAKWCSPSFGCTRRPSLPLPFLWQHNGVRGSVCLWKHIFWPSRKSRLSKLILAAIWNLLRKLDLSPL